MTIKPGELVGIAGQVGSGKSSLLLALLGEMQEANSTKDQGIVLNLSLVTHFHIAKQN